jgi:hypothetical protein
VFQRWLEIDGGNFFKCHWEIDFFRQQNTREAIHWILTWYCFFTWLCLYGNDCSERCCAYHFSRDSLIIPGVSKNTCKHNEIKQRDEIGWRESIPSGRSSFLLEKKMTSMWRNTSEKREKGKCGNGDINENREWAGASLAQLAKCWASGLDTKDTPLARDNQIWLWVKQISMQTYPTDIQIFYFLLITNS